MNKMNKILCIFCSNELERLKAFNKYINILVCNKCLINNCYYRVYIKLVDEEVVGYTFKFQENNELNIYAEKRTNYTEINDHAFEIFIDLSK
jgi:hypothetical protein